MGSFAETLEILLRTAESEQAYSTLTNFMTSCGCPMEGGGPPKKGNDSLCTAGSTSVEVLR